MRQAVDLSVVVPLYDEEENVTLLFPGIEAACASLGVRYEVILVDDASKDSTWERMCELEPGAGELVLARLRRNSGQTAAMAAGFDLARGSVVVSMDGDLQNDPSDIPALVEKCGEGYDLVCGWRKDRQDKLWSRKIPSKCANWLIRRVTGVKVHDYGCSLKAYRQGLVRRMRLYNDMHRFLPFISQQVGARVAELPVKHHARIHGVTKYGLSRVWKVLLDLLSLKVLVHYYRRLLRWFLMMSVPVVAMFLVMLVATLAEERPMVFIGVTAIVGSLGIFIAFLGLISEMVLNRNRDVFDGLLVIDSGTGEAVS